jgi:hypothetical protein
LLGAARRRLPTPAAATIVILVLAAALGQGITATAGSLSHATLVAGGTQNDRFRETMDQLFGPGRWRETSGYRSPAEEDRLRLEGAGTVAAGRISAHSRGTPDAPGAYDAVVYGMPLSLAASMLRQSGTEFAQAFAEGAHGPEGAHLHINVGYGAAAYAALPIETPPQRIRAASRVVRVSCDSIYMRVVGGRRNPLLDSCSNAPG